MKSLTYAFGLVAAQALQLHSAPVLFTEMAQKTYDDYDSNFALASLAESVGQYDDMYAALKAIAEVSLVHSSNMIWLVFSNV